MFILVPFYEDIKVNLNYCQDMSWKLPFKIKMK